MFGQLLRVTMVTLVRTMMRTLLVAMVAVNNFTENKNK